MHCAFWSETCAVSSFEAGQRDALLADPSHINSMPNAAARYLRRYCAAHPEEPPPVRETILGRYPRVGEAVFPALDIHAGD